VPAELAARIEAENNSLYKNRDKVARMKAEVTSKAVTTCGDDSGCLQAEFERADRMAAAYDTALTLTHYPQLTKEKGDTLAQAVLDLAPGVSNASALYELLTGKTATGDEANQYFAAIGLVPVVGGILKKGGETVQVFAQADKALDAAKVGGANGSGKLIAQYGPMNQGPLSEGIAKTFRSGTYHEIVTTEPTTLYRAISKDGNPAGGYWTRTKPAGPVQSIIDSALDQHWGNTATTVFEMRVPAGTRLFEGVAASQRGLVGGGNQIYFDKKINPLNSDWIR